MFPPWKRPETSRPRGMEEEWNVNNWSYLVDPWHPEIVVSLKVASVRLVEEMKFATDSFKFPNWTSARMMVSQMPAWDGLQLLFCSASEPKRICLTWIWTYTISLKNSRSTFHRKNVSRCTWKPMIKDRKMTERDTVRNRYARSQSYRLLCPRRPSQCIKREWIGREARDRNRQFTLRVSDHTAAVVWL